MKTAQNKKANYEQAEDSVKCTMLRRDFGMRRVWRQGAIDYYIHFWNSVIDETQDGLNVSIVLL